MSYVGTDDIQRALEKDGRPHVLACSSQYEFRIITGTYPGMLPLSESQVREFLSARRLLVVGTCLGIGGWTPPVPRRLLDFFVVLQLGNCMTAKRYGYQRQ